jgi:hypothetical protein
MPWELNGNDGVTANNFVGTRNNVPLIIKTNTNGSPANLEEVLRVTPSSQTQRGRVGIGTTSPTQSLTLGAGNVQLPNAQAGTDGNLYFGGRTDAQETGMRLFGGLVNGTIPAGFIDVRTTDPSDGLRIRVDMGSGGTERLRVAATGNIGVGTDNPGQRLTLGTGNVQLPAAQAGTDGNLYFGGRTDAQETGMRLFGGLVNSTIPGGFIDVRTTSNAEGLRIRVDTNDGGSEKLRITPTGIQALVPISQPSDVRTKTNIRQLDGSLDKLACIRGIAFEWSDAPTSAERPGQSNIGVIAQDVEAVFPELVSVYGDEGYKAVNYTGLTAALIEAAKELKAENERLRQRIEALEEKA